MKNPYLIISTGSLFGMKTPGLALALGLKDLGIFKLLDIPASLKNSVSEKSTLKCYLNGLRTICLSDRDVYFYNFHKAYLLLYLVFLIGKFRRPSLLLADGVNCVGLKRFNFCIWSRLFRNIISLPDLVEYKDCASVISFRGLSDTYREVPRSNWRSKKLIFLYNASFIPNNHPEELVIFAFDNPHITVEVTGSRSDFQEYFLKYKPDLVTILPKNIVFLGNLNNSDYRRKLETITAILIFRNERLFENRFNFPSKCIEAVKSRIPIVSKYSISGLPDELYLLCVDSKVPSDSVIQDLIVADNYEEVRERFLFDCSGTCLIKKMQKRQSRVIT